MHDHLQQKLVDPGACQVLWSCSVRVNEVHDHHLQQKLVDPDACQVLELL